ncbi:MAG: hypothetical protein HC836_34530 [Richelia sp. RM2_1_2]|nr:hypothetical protein [Richelia sp. RM1_1_1]NJO63153.1 hypothetical protein [Richelia sp. RM2_1_2]
MLTEILNLQIIVTPDIEKTESAYLIKQLECAELALNAFVKGDLSLSDYCDILLLCDVNVDDYLLQVEDNLSAIGRMT